MFFKKSVDNSAVNESYRQAYCALESMRKFVAMIEFDPKGNILDANELFLSTVGYTLAELKGQHHKIFCSPEVLNSPNYAKHWQDLANGKEKAGDFFRVRKDGSPLIMEATYFPIIDNGKVIRVMKVGTDVTEKFISAKSKADMYIALNKTYAVIEFEPDGTIINANDNFLRA